MIVVPTNVPRNTHTREVAGGARGACGLKGLEGLVGPMGLVKLVGLAELHEFIDSQPPRTPDPRQLFR